MGNLRELGEMLISFGYEFEKISYNLYDPQNPKRCCVMGAFAWRLWPDEMQQLVDTGSNWLNGKFMDSEFSSRVYHHFGFKDSQDLTNAIGFEAHGYGLMGMNDCTNMTFQEIGNVCLRAAKEQS